MEIQAQYMKILKRYSNMVSTKNITLVILATIMVLASNFLNGALETASAGDLSPMYDGPGLCLNCHETQYQEWNQTGHAQAYSNPAFQEEWIQQDSPSACLTCHTTGLDKETGEFQFEGVICEVCHGAGVVMEPVSTAEICSTCHSFSPFPIYQEWLESEHSHAEVDCIDCHEFHGLELKAESPTELCTSCHAEKISEVVEETHGSNEYECIDCHMVSRPYDGENGESAVLGHTFIPGPPSPDCMSCHEVLLEGHDIWGQEEDNCLTCHDSLYMTKLHLLNGTSVALSEASILCNQCHGEEYYEWEMGIHSGQEGQDKQCTDCHSPMRPYIMGNYTLPPVERRVTSSSVGGLTLSPSILMGAALALGGGVAVAYYGLTRRRYENGQ